MSRNKRNRRLFGIAAILFLIFSSENLAYAVDESAVGFSVTPIYNEQQNKDSSFFDLSVTPNSKQNIGVTVTNSSQEKAAYTIQVIQASTNPNGIIDYSDAKGEQTSQIPVDLAKQAFYEKKIELAAGESKKVPIKIVLPSTPFSGEVLGGINVVKQTTKAEKNKAQLTNQYSYVLGLRMREGDTNPKRNLTAGKVKAQVSFGNPGISLPIINDQATSMGHLKVTSVLSRNGQEVKKELYKDREIAPNSVYPYSLSWDKKEYLPGDYKLLVEISDKQDHKWSFEKSFSLTAKEVKNIQAQAIHPKQDYMSVIIVIIAGLMIIGLILYVYKLKKDIKKKNKKGRTNE